MLAYQADLGSAETFVFQVVSQSAYGARASRSNRHQEHRVNAFTFHQSGDLTGGAFVALRRQSSLDRVVKIGDRADEPLSG